MRIGELIGALLRKHLTRNRAEIGMGIAGLGALVTPLLLWISWSPDALKMVLIFGFGCFLLAIWFAQYAAPEYIDPDQERLPRPGELPLSREDAERRARRRDSWRDVS